MTASNKLLSKSCKVISTSFHYVFVGPLNSDKISKRQANLAQIAAVVKYVKETISFLAPKIWAIVP